MHIFKNSRWQRSPYWISKIDCHFFTIWPIVTKFDGNVENVTYNAFVTLKTLIYLNSRWRRPPSWNSEIGCHFFTIGSIVIKFSENVENLTKDATVALKLHIYQIQDGESRHLDFRKSVAISLLFDQSSPNSVGMLRLWHRTQLLHWNCIFTEIRDGGRRHLEFWKSVAIS